jgi:hypothetical protein
MAAANGAQREERAGEAVTEEQLLDVLYEIMAQGVDPTAQLKIGEVERFLHEHARQRKPLAELMAFFARHGLSRDPADYAADPDLGELASGLSRARGPSSTMILLEDSPLEAPLEPPPEPALPLVTQETSGLKAVVLPVSQRPDARVRWLPIALAAAGAVALGMLAFSVQRSRDLSQDLARARLQQQTTGLALGALERRADELSQQLGQSEAERRQLTERIETYMNEGARQHAAEAEALTRLLGPKYDALRSRSLQASSEPR